jgi:hypothetical protein
MWVVGAALCGRLTLCCELLWVVGAVLWVVIRGCGWWALCCERLALCYGCVVGGWRCVVGGCG